MKFHLNRKQLCIPYALFLILFVIIPLVLIMIYAFMDSDGNFTFGNFTRFFTDPTAITTFLRSVGIGVTTTALCLVIAYPLAYLLANSKYNKSSIMVMLFIMPMWINFVLRTAATKELLNFMGLLGKDYAFINTTVGMVYNYLPFMILPLYTTMLKLDKSCIEAAEDLGANGRQVFFRAVVPMTMPGIVSGVTMVFMPTMTCFVVSDMLSERSLELLGNLINREFQSGSWNHGAAIAFILLIIIFVTMLITGRLSNEDNTRGGLW